MWLDTELGRGSTFGFSVPLARKQPATRPRSRGTVVLIEDDRTSAELFSAYLEGTGIDLVKVRDGDDGLARVRRVKPSAVLLDIRLPGMDGWEVLSALQGDPVTAEIPVIEDNALNLKLVRDVLQHAGYEVVSAKTGEEGLAVAASCEPDLVLMDVQLPGIDGTEALRRLRENGESRVPVVAVTAFAMRADRDRAFDAGFDGYLEKPISIRSLPAQVQSFLNGGK